MCGLKRMITAAAFTAPVMITFLDVVGYLAKVDGYSMQPTLNPGTMRGDDTVWLNKWAVRNYSFQRGEVVSLKAPYDPSECLIKRIIGMPGDNVETLNYKNRHVVIPEGHLWVEGDNHVNSKDSNMFGPVPMGLVYAKAGSIVWPPKRWQTLKIDVPCGRVEYTNNKYRKSTSQHCDKQSGGVSS